MRCGENALVDEIVNLQSGLILKALPFKDFWKYICSEKQQQQQQQKTNGSEYICYYLLLFQSVLYVRINFFLPEIRKDAASFFIHRFTYWRFIAIIFIYIDVYTRLWILNRPHETTHFGLINFSLCSTYNLCVCYFVCPVFISQLFFRLNFISTFNMISIV